MIVSLADITEVTQKAGEKVDNEWLYHEIIASLPDNLIEQAAQRMEFNIQLSIDNTLVEPVLMNDILSNLDKYVNDVADLKVAQKLADLEGRYEAIFAPLEEATKAATDKIKSDFNIPTVGRTTGDAKETEDLRAMVAALADELQGTTKTDHTWALVREAQAMIGEQSTEG